MVENCILQLVKYESFMLGNRGPRAIEAYEGDEPEVCSRLDIFVKDMGIVTAAAKSAGIAVPQ